MISHINTYLVSTPLVYFFTLDQQNIVSLLIIEGMSVFVIMVFFIVDIPRWILSHIMGLNGYIIVKYTG